MLSDFFLELECLKCAKWEGRGDDVLLVNSQEFDISAFIISAGLDFIRTAVIWEFHHRNKSSK